MEGLASGSVWTHEAEEPQPPAVAVAVLVAAFSLQPGWIVSVWTLALVPVGGAGARLWCSVLSL